MVSQSLFLFPLVKGAILELCLLTGGGGLCGHHSHETVFIFIGNFCGMVENIIHPIKPASFSANRFFVLSATVYALHIENTLIYISQIFTC